MMTRYILLASGVGFLTALVLLINRVRQPKAIDPNTLGTLSQQWFSDRRNDL